MLHTSALTTIQLILNDCPKFKQISHAVISLTHSPGTTKTPLHLKTHLNTFDCFTIRSVTRRYPNLSISIKTFLLYECVRLLLPCTRLEILCSTFSSVGNAKVSFLRDVSLSSERLRMIFGPSKPMDGMLSSFRDLIECSRAFRSIAFDNFN